MRVIIGVVVAVFGAVGMFGSYVSMVLTPTTFVVLFLGKVLGIFEGAWFSVEHISVFGTPLIMLFGGLICLGLSFLTTIVGAAMVDTE